MLQAIEKFTALTVQYAPDSRPLALTADGYYALSHDAKLRSAELHAAGRDAEANAEYALAVAYYRKYRRQLSIGYCQPVSVWVIGAVS